MKIVLFCKKHYAFGIMMPLFKELQKQNHETIWYIPEEINTNIPQYIYEATYTSSIKELLEFNAAINFAPGNDFPHYLPGVKVQIFHGMAGEKSGHFHIRSYFDLYLTQGPYFTNRFNKLQQKHKNFSVKETGWCKLDTLFSCQQKLKTPELKKYKKILLYAPTFSPSLTSAIKHKDQIIKLTEDKECLLYMKFHDKMDKNVTDEYISLAKNTENMIISNDPDIIPLLQTCDLMISDTSSVVYEFLLLDKPVITFNSHSENIRWDNLDLSDDLSIYVDKNLKIDPYKDQRKWFIENYHPFIDGKSSLRMIEASIDYIETNGIPKERKIPFLRRRKMNKTFGKKPSL